MKDAKVYGFVGLIIVVGGSLGCALNQFKKSAKQKERAALTDSPVLRKNNARKNSDAYFAAFMTKFRETHQTEAAVRAAGSVTQPFAADMRHASGFAGFEPDSV